MLSKLEYMHVAYWSFDGKRSMDHFNIAACSDFSNVLKFPAVLQKLQDPSAQGRIVNYYQKPQKLINKLLDMFSRPGEWVLDAFSGSGTTIACALKKGRNCVAVDIDPEAVKFIKMRLAALPSLPDENEELGAKSSSEFAKKTSSEVQPPMSSAVGDDADFVEIQAVGPKSESLVVPAIEDAQTEQPAAQQPGTSQEDPVLTTVQSLVQDEGYDLDI